MVGNNVFKKFEKTDKFKIQKKILADNTLNTSIPDFSQVATTNEGLFKTEDSDGDTYYYRGAVTNNYLKFANFWWRIIRVNGDGSLRIIYDGTSAHENGEASDNRHIGTTSWGNNVGFLNKTISSVENSEITNIKTKLDEWYSSNLLDYEDYIDKEAGFYNDRQTSSSGSYMGLYRVQHNEPSLMINQETDLFTIKRVVKGNNALTYPIGLITVDEAVFAGATEENANYNYYLRIGKNCWTISPRNYYNTYKCLYLIYSTGFLYTGSSGSNTSFTTSSNCIRPVINLRGDLELEGNGTSANPYKIKES